MKNFIGFIALCMVALVSNAQTSVVTFNVDFNYTGFPNADYDAATVNGNWNGWGAWGVPLEDLDGDNIWTGSIELNEGAVIEYVVAGTGAADGYGGWGSVWNAAGLECALPGTNNWHFTVGADDMTINMCPLGCTETCSDPGEPVSLTFQVDMNTVGANPAGVYIAGDFIGWGFDAMSDPDGDGIYTYTAEGIVAGSLIQWKYMNGPGWGYEETVPGACATPEYGNRFFQLEASDATTDLVCYGECVSCDVEIPEHEVTFNVNMANETVAETGVYLAGGGNFGNPGDNEMTDPDGDGIYSITLMLDEGFSSYYTFTNGACGDWSCKENLAGLPCGDPANYNDRFLPAVTGPTSISTCFGQCSTDGTCESVSEASVTFRVDMNTVSVAGDVTIFGGTLNGWGFPGEVMSDDDGDGIYEYTATLPAGGHEYKFVNSGSDEALDSLDAACTLTTGDFTNRIVYVEGGVDMVLDAVCWESCDACEINEGDVYGCTSDGATNYDPTATVDDGSCLFTTTFNVDMTCAGVDFTTVHITGPTWGWTADILMSDDDADGTYTITMDVPGPTIEYKYMVDYWAHQEDLIDDMLDGATCAPVTDYGSYANRLADSGTTTSDAYGTCLTCDEVSGPVFVDVAFAIDMNYTGFPNADYDNVVINGSWNGWLAWGVTLADDDMDGVFTGTLTLEEGSVFEFVIAATGPADGWSGWGSIFNAPTECEANPGLPIGAGGGNYIATATEGAMVQYCAGSCAATCLMPGCTDPFFAEFDLYAEEDDGSCVTPVVFGCVYEDATNYNADATNDDGSCEFELNTCPGDLDGDGLVATPDLLSFLSVFGTTCE
ncbi:MAG: hypothetical protein O2818_05040 [Bacteroidetes bacterium]|nr:hypothetical protein [Bacteroidota bacterium]MDA1336236.1 hypothetical protein [Bacteroidota bacterium]